MSWSTVRELLRGESANALVEVTFMAPWIFFLFMGVLDVGFYMYAGINTENAARMAAMYTSSSIGAAADTATACTFVLAEVGSMPFPNGRPTSCVIGASPCVKDGSLVSDAAPVYVCAQQVAPLDGEPSPPVFASSVTVTLRTLNMIPIPGLLAKQFNITRQSVMRVKDDL